MKLRYLGLWLTTLSVLGVVAGLTAGRERLAASGQPIFLRLAPVDPRSLIQGDYMALSYDIARQLGGQTRAREGRVVVELDDNRIARYTRLYDGQTPLADKEIILRYRRRAHGVRIGPESFFFQEGYAHYYNQAQYAEVRVSPSGDVLLVGLRGRNLEELGPPGGK